MEVCTYVFHQIQNLFLFIYSFDSIKRSNKYRQRFLNKNETYLDIFKKGMRNINSPLNTDSAVTRRAGTVPILCWNECPSFQKTPASPSPRGPGWCRLAVVVSDGVRRRAPHPIDQGTLREEANTAPPSTTSPPLLPLLLVLADGRFPLVTRGRSVFTVACPCVDNTTRGTAASTRYVCVGWGSLGRGGGCDDGYRRQKFLISRQVLYRARKATFFLSNFLSNFLSFFLFLLIYFFIFHFYLFDLATFFFFPFYYFIFI